MILDSYENNSQEVTLEYKGEDIDVYEQNITFTDERPRCYVDVAKILMRRDEYVEGALYGLYTDDVIYAKNGDKILDKDTLLEVGKTCETGYYIFEADIPIDHQYYVRELELDYFYEVGGDQFQFEYRYENDTKYDYSFIQLWEIIKYTRKISRDTLDTLDPRSAWRTNTELYKKLKDGLESEESIYEFEFDHDDIEAAKEYIRSAPLSRESNIEFWNKFLEPNRIK